MKKCLKKILYPNKIIGFLFFNLGFGLLIYVFSCHLEETPIAYTSYLLSFYALILFCIWFYKACQFGNKSIKASHLYSLYEQHSFVVTKIQLYFSLVFNFLYGVFKFGIGMYYQSWWFIIFAIYYLLLCTMKIPLARNLKHKMAKDTQKEYKKLKEIGKILLFLNFIFIGMIVLIIKQNQIIEYKGFLIYLVALYDFYLIIHAIRNVVKYRKNHSPLLTSSKCINLTVAMISLVSLEVAMVCQFGENDAHFKLVMTSCMGFGICIINSFMAFFMITKANKSLKQI